MRTESQMDDHRARMFNRFVAKCKKCKGGESVNCVCRTKMDFAIAAYEACIPQDFWHIAPPDVTHNRSVFDSSVLPYVAKLKLARRRGYGQIFYGDNGAGKTFFISYVLTQVIKKGGTAYFTTMPDLDHNMKRGFKDKDLENRLEFLLTSDFVAIDELGKERAKADPTFSDGQVERLLKRRLDDAQPMLLGTNMEPGDLAAAYGPTVESMLAGKFQQIIMEPGDFRANLRDRMVKEMGYEE